jgi:hypothetical protein
MVLDSNVWGPHYWFVLLSIAICYPIHPNDVTKKKYYELIHNFPLFMPDSRIGNKFSELLDKYPITPYLDSRDSFIKWVHFIHNRVNKIIGKDAREKLKDEGFIEIAALAYMRGWNVDNTILVFEEAQNTTPAQMKLLLTRIGFNSKFFISGDLEQSDKFKDKTKSGLYDAKKRLGDVKGIGVFEFGMEDIVRNPIISEILNRYD